MMDRALHRRARPVARLLAVLVLVLVVLHAGGVAPLGTHAAAGPSLTTTATIVVSLIARGDDAGAERYFAPILQAAAPAEKLQQLWAQLTAQLGAFKRQTGAQEQTINGVQSVFVHCLFAHATADLVISFDSSGKVAGLHVANTQPSGPPPGTATITPRAALLRVLTKPLQASWFAPAFLAVESVGRIAQGLAAITAILGPFQGLAAQPEPDGSFLARFRDGIASVLIHLDRQGRIDALALTNPRLTVTGLQPPGAAAGPAGPAAAVNALLARRLEHHQFSGVVLVAIKGKVVLARGYGDADAARHRPNTVDTAFRIGSITKQFTAMAILELQQAGKLSVHDKLCRYVTPCPAAWAPITLQEMLNHTSGLANYTGLPAYLSGSGRPITQAQLLGLVRPLPLDFTPGTRFEYSNTNYYLLGTIIDKVSGQTYAAYLHKHIFAPLRLHQTGYDTNHPDLRTHAVGYTTWGVAAPYVDLSWPFAAGALSSTVGDLWRWDQALQSNTLISRAATADMLTAHVATCPPGPAPCPFNATDTHYGDGWFSGRLGGHLVIDHGGDINGFSAMNEFLPDDGITIVLLSNQADSGASSFLGLALAQIMVGQHKG